MNEIVHKMQHVPNFLKQLMDYGAWGSVLMSWIMSVTPVFNFIIIILALIWGYFRILDIRLSIKLKKLQIRRHNDV